MFSSFSTKDGFTGEIQKTAKFGKRSKSNALRKFVVWVRFACHPGESRDPVLFLNLIGTCLDTGFRRYDIPPNEFPKGFGSKRVVRGHYADSQGAPVFPALFIPARNQVYCRIVNRTNIRRPLYSPTAYTIPLPTLPRSTSASAPF
jgi:hypothetical protein